MDSDNFDDDSDEDDDERRRDDSGMMVRLPSNEVPSSRTSPRRRCGVAGTLLLSVVLFLSLYILRDVDDETPWWWSSSSEESSLRNITATSPVNSSILVPIVTTTKRTADGKPVYHSPNHTNDNISNNNDKEEDVDARLMAALRHKLRPRPLRLLPAIPAPHDDGDSTTTTSMSSPRQLVPQQFLHLHHMKTGGTSMDGLIQRLQQQQVDSSEQQLTFAYTSIHECGYQQYQRCVSGIDVACAERIRTAAIMSYCAPLRDLSTPAFAWNKNVTNKNDTATIDQTVVEEDERAAITVLRHPVGRVWSMFRFQTRSCYSCRPLLDIYRDIDNNNNTTLLTENCRMQLLNHQTRNLLAEPNDFPAGADQAAGAIRNLEQFFTMVGLTDNMTATATMVQHVFPWLAEDLDWEKAIQTADSDGTTSSLSTSKTKSTSTTKCLMGHQNASPQNNHCLDNGKKHWALPDTPDDETIQAIIAHNNIDLLVYEAAVQLFARQQRALGLVVG
jgi:hypothetical protein